MVASCDDVHHEINVSRIEDANVMWHWNPSLIGLSWYPFTHGISCGKKDRVECPILLPNAFGNKWCHRQQIKTCAVVSSAGCLLGSQCGPQIDNDYDYVFRINEPVLNDTFRKDVGNKTTIMVLNNVLSSHVLNEKALRMNTTSLENLDVIYFPKQFVDEFRSFDMHHMRSIHHWGRVCKIDEDFIIAVKEWTSMFSIFEPTKGMYTILLATYMCDSVHAYGFRGEQIGQPYHYWDHPSSTVHKNGTTNKKSSMHSFDLEHELINTLATIGLQVAYFENYVETYNIFWIPVLLIFISILFGKKCAKTKKKSKAEAEKYNTLVEMATPQLD